MQLNRPFAVHLNETGSRPVIVVEGELDLSSCELLEAAFRRMDAGEPAETVLDLRAVTFLDSTGLSLLLAEESRARADGRRLLLVRPPEPAARVFRLTRLEDRFEFVEG